MIPTTPVPDAVLLPEKWKRGPTLWHRLDSVLSIAEPILGLARGCGRVRKTHEPGGWLFITGDPEDTIYGPAGTPLAGQPRYHWIVRPDGSRWGYLIGPGLSPGKQ